MSFVHLACGGAGTVPVDSGLPRVGELYGVEANGDLRWYRYDGVGQSTPEGSIGWAPNSRNVIGNGWHGFKFLCGGGERSAGLQPAVSRVCNPQVLKWIRRRPPVATPCRLQIGDTAG